MKLLVDIDEKLLEKVRHLSGAKTKKETIVISMQEYLNLHERKKLAGLIGSGRPRMSLEGLRKSRKQWEKF